MNSPWPIREPLLFGMCSDCGAVEVEPGFALCLDCVDERRVGDAVDAWIDDERERAAEDASDAELVEAGL